MFPSLVVDEQFSLHMLRWETDIPRCRGTCFTSGHVWPTTWSHRCATL